MKICGRQRSHPVNRGLALFVMGIASTCLRSTAQAEEFWLITPVEAAMPGALPNNIGSSDPFSPRSLAPFEVGREIDTVPLIQVLKPATDKIESTPVEVSVKFAARSAPVDISSLKVQVVKLILIDITDRVRPFTDVEGIHIPDATPSSHRASTRSASACRTKTEG